MTTRGWENEAQGNKTHSVTDAGLVGDFEKKKKN
ncbi:hypothetical protein QG37_07830 [Candidozyma auris]|uniref:Uncharacterized protein n=1 Tax=Candidozyma auris TaxID=498019 RepID=A0A0L0NP00_CANAR|nr:hypothetical protein QG37_07830 [[Candida] auris]